MSKKEFNVDINIDIKNRTKKHFKSGVNLMECEIDVPAVHPKEINIDDKLYTISVKPVVNRKVLASDGNFYPETGVTGLKLVGVNSEVVDTIAKKMHGSREFRSFNGLIELPVDGKVARTTLSEAYFTDEETANSVAMAAIEVELEKVEAMEKEIAGAKKLLSDVRNHYAGLNDAIPYEPKESEGKSGRTYEVSLSVGEEDPGEED